MLITFSTRHMENTPALKQHAEQKAGKLNRYFDRIQSIEIVLESIKDIMRAEVRVYVEHNHVLVSHHDEPDAYAAIDGSIHKMERQLAEHKQMMRNRKHPEATK
ncbi:MAG TPA: ribosome-associated translation inhibitor RaiA [Tepidisphaeraceae bacterium]|nr:ribosome-associated translation inhibitor RaiA [Tepidisphaeraceae bacterium]